MRFIPLARLGAGFVAFVLAGCHGGSSMPPGAPATSSPTSTLGNASFTVGSGQGVQSLVVTLTQVNGVAPAVKAAAFTMNLTATTAGCTPATGGTLSCTAMVPAPIGNDMFTVTTYAGQNGAGSVVASTQANAVIVGTGKTNCVAAKAAPGTAI